MLDWLAHASVAHPDRVALISEGRRWSFRELNAAVAEMAGRLAAGVQSGDHVAVLMPNRAEFVQAIHALARLGAVLVPLNVRLTPRELAWQIDRADCTFLVCSQQTEDQATRAAHHAPRTTHHTSRTTHHAPRILSVDQPQLSEMTGLADQPPQPEAFHAGRPLDLDATQGIIFTSGTTGQLKGARLTFRNHLMSATASAFRLGTLAGDRWLACMPLYHVGGLAIVLRCCLYGTAVVLHAGFDAEAVSHALAAGDVTLVSLVPTMLHRILELRGERPFPQRLRCVLLGGGPAPASLLERAMALDVPVATTYGLTEAASQVATAAPGEIQDQMEPAEGAVGHYVGRPLLFCEVRILDAEDAEAPAGQIGEIVVRGPNVMSGYYNQPEATAGALRDGWLHTGDLGYLDGAGNLWMVQRRSDLIVTGGENVYPAEVEGVLLEHPGVEAVCVVGVEDGEWGQRVAAAVVVDPTASITAEDVEVFCDARLAGYKRPRLLRFVEALPRTASGKVQRGAVAGLFRS